MHLRVLTLFCLLTVFTLNICATDKSLTLKFGPYWPQDLKHSERPTAFDWTVLSGISFDKTVTLGAGFDFIWNKNSKENKIAPNLFQEELIERTLMFPVTAFLSISPLPDFIVSPSISGQAGIGFLHFSKKDIYEKDINEVESLENLFGIYDENGWYFGAVFKIAVDALINLSPHASLFGGLDYLWSKPKKIKRSDPHLFTRRNMNGWGLRFGINLFL
jgi:hypothetical protein